MTLAELVERLDSLHEYQTVCVRVPWAADSEARLYQIGPTRTELEREGLKYFLEVFLIQEVVSVLLARKRDVTLDDKIAGVIYYALNDAYPPWFYDVR